MKNNQLLVLAAFLVMIGLSSCNSNSNQSQDSIVEAVEMSQEDKIAHGKYLVGS